MSEEKQDFLDELKVLSPSKSEVSDFWLQKIFDLSRVVFAKEFEEAAQELVLTGHTNSATNLVEWRANMLHHTGEIVYTIKKALVNEVEEEEVTAFAFTFERAAASMVDNNPQRPLHIWIAGCHPLHRRKKLMKQIFELVEERAKAKDYTVLTVNTYPQKFEHMPKFLDSQGFELAEILDNVVNNAQSVPTESNHAVKYCYRKYIL